MAELSVKGLFLLPKLRIGAHGSLELVAGGPYWRGGPIGNPRFFHGIGGFFSPRKLLFTLFPDPQGGGTLRTSKFGVVPPEKF